MATLQNIITFNGLPYSFPTYPRHLRDFHAACSKKRRHQPAFLVHATSSNKNEELLPQQKIAVTVGNNNNNGGTSSSGDNQQRMIKDVVVVGGGTAGWMTASYLAKALGNTATVTVLQAPEISSLGVGEATVPDLQSGFFDFLGIPETEWMPECNASFKMAVKYINWRTPGPATPHPRPCARDHYRNLADADYFYNVFGRLRHHDGVPLSQYWVKDLVDGTGGVPPEPFMYACYTTTPALDAKRSPRLMDGTPECLSAWHFDAHLVADFLRRHSTSKLGVRHIQEKMIRAEMDPLRPDHIRALHTSAGTRIPADLFIDCTGFRGLLINGVLQEPFLPSHHLLCDSAVAAQVPHDDAAHGIEPYTSAIAMDSGWTWKIPMLGRFGTGYVYSSAFASEEKATEDFCRLWGLDDGSKLNKIRFRVGRNRRAWVGNVVSIGAASCFLEPLESTGIFFIYTALYYLMQSFPDMEFREGCAGRFNESIEKMFVEMQDFLQLHFCFSPRTDTEFWRASAELEAKLSDRAKHLMGAYKAGLLMFPEEPAPGTLGQQLGAYRPGTVFLNHHFYNVIAGVGNLPECAQPRLRHMPASVASASHVFADIRRRQRHLLHTLPSLYDYLRRLHRLDDDPRPPQHTSNSINQKSSTKTTIKK